MKIQVVYSPRHFSYDLDWLDAFKDYGAELIQDKRKLDADLIVIHHSMNGQWNGYSPHLKNECIKRKGKLVIFHTNEFKVVRERELAAIELGADYICTQLADGRLYKNVPVISMPHALNPKVYRDMGLKRDISVGFRGSKYKTSIHDERALIVNAFRCVKDSDIVMDQAQFLNRKEWAYFLNRCKAMVGTESGSEGNRIISPRHLDAIGTKTLQILKSGEYCGVIDKSHYVPFTTVKEAMEIVNDDKARKEITERALIHVLENHTYKHRIEKLINAINTIRY